jgi:hypothetical protein
MSNTEQFIYDIISYINRGDYQQVRWCTLNSITPVNEAFNDRTLGWVATVNFNGPGVLDYCAYPPA